MKVRHFLFTSAITIAAAFPTFPTNAQEVSSAPQTGIPPAPGVVLVELFRYYNPRTNDRYTGREMPLNWERLGWKLEGSLGFISYVPFAGGHTLYSCIVNREPDNFTSTDPNCEGQAKNNWAPIIGYVSSSAIPGTTPLYRCDTPRYAEDHFDTLSPTCEGNKPGSVLEGVLGYVFL